MGKKILLADDSITIQKVIELTFSDEDFDVVTVGNGRLAIERLEEVRPDVVLCDIIMPEKDGYEVCDHIKKHPSLSHTPVLLLTGAFEPFDQERAARVGCDGFLAKPFEPQALIAKVKELLVQGASRPAAPWPTPVAAPPPPAPAPAPEPVFAPSPAPPFIAPPVAAPPPTPEPEPAVTFIPEEPVVEEAPASYEPPMELAPEEPVVAEEPLVSPPAMESDLYGMGEPVEATPEELAPLTHEEQAAFAPAPDDASSTVMFRPAEVSPWAQPTKEVPLEERAQASVQAAAAAGTPVFEESFEPASAPAPAEELLSGPEPEPEPIAAPEPEPVFAPEPTFVPEPAIVSEAPVPEPAVAAPAPAPTPAPVEASFAEVAPPPAAEVSGPPPSHAAEVTVPVDQVAQIAQRVVAQISERVVREIAWEVIPDLAEALIKKEIERLRAELEKA